MKVLSKVCLGCSGHAARWLVVACTRDHEQNHPSQHLERNPVSLKQKTPERPFRRSGVGSSSRVGVQASVCKTLAAQQLPRCLVVQVNIVEWIGHNFGHPNQACFDIFQEEQMHGAEQQGCCTQNQPGVAHSAHEFKESFMLRQNAHPAWVHVNGQGQQSPDAEQNHFASQVVAHLDFFLVVVGGLVDMVITQRFKEKVARLTRCHGHRPSQQGGDRGVNEQKSIRHDEGHGTQQVQGLVDAAVVVITVVIPTLNTQFFKKIFHAVTL